jgi:hypothetical protein
MTLLYLVTESDSDAVFYTLCAKKLTGSVYDPVPMKNRKGDGVGAVKEQLRRALRMAKAAAGSSQAVAFIAAIDNDRAPHDEHGAHEAGDETGRRKGTGLERQKLNKAERDYPKRLEWMTKALEEELRPDRTKWPMPVAVAVAVEMLESWIVRSLREHPPQPMPHFSKADSERARNYYAPSNPPPQWKDLAAEEHAKSGCTSKGDFYQHVVNRLDADALAQRSLSFRMFKEWLDDWPRATATA